MREHHARVVQRLVENLQNDPRFLALIIGGSVAKGWANEDSDVDILLVASDEEFAHRISTMDLGYYDRDIADYPGGYVDGKIIDLSFLHDVANHGSEPARAAFLGAIVAYSRIPGLDALVASIPTYPEQERAAKMRAFVSQLAILNWYVEEAEKRQNRYLLSWAANNMVLYGGRLILAQNRLLYPYHKWFLHQLELAASKPENILNLIDVLLQHPNAENARVFYESVTTFLNWEIDLGQAGVEFTRNTEWNWRDGHPPLPDW
jgi:predicted nucleotidyltransferase